MGKKAARARKKQRKRARVKTSGKQLTPEIRAKLESMPTLPDGRPNPLYKPKPMINGFGLGTVPQGGDGALMAKYNQLGQKFADTTNTVQALKEAIAKRKEDTKKLEEDKEKLEKEDEEYKRKEKVAKEKYDKMKKKYQDRMALLDEQAKQGVLDLKTQIQAQEQELQELRQNNKIQQDQLHQAELQAKLNSQNKQLKSAKEIQEMEEELQAVKQENEQIKLQMAEDKTQADNFKAEVDLTIENMRLENEKHNQEAQEYINKLRNRRSALKLFASAKQIEAENAAKNFDLKTQEFKLLTEQKNQQITQELNTQKQANQKLTAELNKMKLEETGRQTEHQKKMEELTNDYNTKMQEIETQKQELNKQIRDHQYALEQAKKNHHQAQADIELTDMNRKLKDLTVRINGLPVDEMSGELRDSMVQVSNEINEYNNYLDKITKEGIKPGEMENMIRSNQAIATKMKEKIETLGEMNDTRIQKKKELIQQNQGYKNIDEEIELLTRRQEHLARMYDAATAIETGNFERDNFGDETNAINQFQVAYNLARQTDLELVDLINEKITEEALSAAYDPIALQMTMAAMTGQIPDTQFVGDADDYSNRDAMLSAIRTVIPKASFRSKFFGNALKIKPPK